MKATWNLLSDNFFFINNNIGIYWIVKCSMFTNISTWSHSAPLRRHSHASNDGPISCHNFQVHSRPNTYSLERQENDFEKLKRNNSCICDDNAANQNRMDKFGEIQIKQYLKCALRFQLNEDYMSLFSTLTVNTVQHSKYIKIPLLSSSAFTCTFIWRMLLYAYAYLCTSHKHEMSHQIYLHVTQKCQKTSHKLAEWTTQCATFFHVIFDAVRTTVMTIEMNFPIMWSIMIFKIVFSLEVTTRSCKPLEQLTGTLTFIQI